MATSNSSWARAVVERVTIDHVGHRGDGVSLTTGDAVYVPYTLGGESVEVDHVAGHPDRRKLLAVDVASPERVEPFCPHFGICGGCAIQHWAAEPYRAWKRDIVVETLAQAGIDCEVAPLVDAHGAGRRRVTLHGRFGTHDVLKVGFSAASSHDVIPIHRCPILDPALDGALDAAWALAEPLTSKMAVTKPLDIQVTATASGLDVDVRGSGPLPTPLVTALSRVAEQHRLARLTRHGELVLQRLPPTIKMGRTEVTLPPGSFLQATVAGKRRLLHSLPSALARQGRFSISSAASARSLSGSPKRRVSRLTTMTPARSPRSRRPRARRDSSRSRPSRATCSAVRWCRRSCAILMR